MQYRDKVCRECAATFKPSTGNQVQCPDCRAPRECEDCGTDIKRSATKCTQCRLAVNPNSVQCPNYYCLQWHIPTKGTPHRCTRDVESSRTVPEDMRVLTGPELPTKAALSLTGGAPPPLPVKDRAAVCQCGSAISGRARWGSSWGGECDRAEQRVEALINRI